MKTIVIFLNADRAEFLQSKADVFAVELIPDPSGLYEVRISFDDDSLDITMLKLFHHGIQLGMKTAQNVIDIAYKPTQYKVDDIMGLAHD
jgi:hypothetical protein